jgi:glycosyltransferase involved in cell wall biosynthesis
MKVPPLISVVMIFWNARPFFKEAIQSVFNQSYPAWELLLVDDGSADGSAEIALQAAARHPGRVHYLHHEGRQNRGMSASRNLGIFHSNGEFVAFLDADDVWLPDILADQAALMAAHPEAAMVFGQLLYWYGWNGAPEDCQRDYVEALGVPPNTLVRPPVLVPLFLQNKAAVPSGILVRRGLFEQVGPFEEAFRGEYEDQVFCAKVCLQAPVFAAGQCWYRYRQHQGSSVAVGHQTGETASARLSFLNWLETYLIEQNISDPLVWQALHQELRPFRHPTMHRLTARLRQFNSQVQTWIRPVLD